MSYDYLMFHRPPWHPRWLARVKMFTSRDGWRGMGTPEELMKRISAIFPGTSWRKTDLSGVRALQMVAIKGSIDPNAPSWSGLGGPEFSWSADVDGQVKHMQASRIEPREVRLLERRLGMVSLDLQRDGFLGMIFG